MEKKKTGLIVLVIILSLLVTGLGGYLVYDKVINKNNNIEDKKGEAIKMPDKSYIGTWIEDEKYPTNADELTILEINEDTIKFNLFLYRIIDIVGTAKIEDNKIKFTGVADFGGEDDGGFKFSGTLVFNNNTIKLSIDKSNHEDVPEREYTFTFKNVNNEGILNGDFSKFSGEYINQAGEKLTLLSNGKIAEHSNNIMGTVTKNSGIDEATKAFAGTYNWAYEPDGVDAILFPVGIEVWDSSGDEIIPTDTSKIRLFVGQGIGEENIYYKK